MKEEKVKDVWWLNELAIEKGINVGYKNDDFKKNKVTHKEKYGK